MAAEDFNNNFVHHKLCGQKPPWNINPNFLFFAAKFFRHFQGMSVLPTLCISTPILVRIA